MALPASFSCHSDDDPPPQHPAAPFSTFRRLRPRAGSAPITFDEHDPLEPPGIFLSLPRDPCRLPRAWDHRTQLRAPRGTRGCGPFSTRELLPVTSRLTFLSGSTHRRKGHGPHSFRAPRRVAIARPSDHSHLGAPAHAPDKSAARCAPALVRHTWTVPRRGEGHRYRACCRASLNSRQCCGTRLDHAQGDHVEKPGSRRASCHSTWTIPCADARRDRGIGRGVDVSLVVVEPSDSVPVSGADRKLSSRLSRR